MKDLIIPARWTIAVAVLGLLPFAAAQTVSYTNAGVYTNVVPAGIQQATFKLWGAGGGGSLRPPPPVPLIGLGGGGAFSSVTLAVQPGDAFVIVVGQGGATHSALLGGAGSGNTEGGDPGVYDGSVGRSQGGQASSVFLLTNNLLVMKAVAGAGGGAGVAANGGPGGQPAFAQPPASGGLNGANGIGGAGAFFGGDYNTNALTTGIAALNLAGGNGGNGVIYSGGGGGGYGGGGGGASDPMTGGSGGGGGGSYGASVMLGGGSAPGNTADPNYIAGAGQGGAAETPGAHGLAVVIWTTANPPAPTLVHPARLGDGSFQFSFTNLPNTTFSVLATTNLANPNSWSVLGTAAQISAGQFQFADTQATNYPQRFYRVRSE